MRYRLYIQLHESHSNQIHIKSSLLNNMYLYNALILAVSSDSGIPSDNTVVKVCTFICIHGQYIYKQDPKPTPE